MNEQVLNHANGDGVSEAILLGLAFISAWGLIFVSLKVLFGLFSKGLPDETKGPHPTEAALNKVEAKKYFLKRYKAAQMNAEVIPFKKV